MTTSTTSIVPVRRLCTTCNHRLAVDDGYSNYTVEGTEISCLLGLHPSGTFDRFYGECPEVLHAEVCEQYVPGDGIKMDVEKENLPLLTESDWKRLRYYQAAALIDPKFTTYPWMRRK